MGGGEMGGALFPPAPRRKKKPYSVLPPPKDRREGLVRRPKGAHPKKPVGKFFLTSLSGTDVRVW